MREHSKVQLSECQQIFAELYQRAFLPATEAYRDISHQALDAALFRMLGLDESLLASLDLLRHKWCAVPSVYGGKSTRPPDT